MYPGWPGTFPVYTHRAKVVINCSPFTIKNVLIWMIN